MLGDKNNQKINIDKKKDILQVLLATGISLGLFLLLFLIRDLFPLGDGSVLMIDLHSQYVPLLYRFYDVVTGQKNLFMDFSAAGGAYLYADTVNEILNPFNYVLLLFGRERIYLAVNVLLALYGTGAAVSSCICLQKLWPQNREWNVPLSLCYALSGFMAAQFQIIKWMYLVVLFPLFLLALFRLLREKKWGAYALLLGYQLMLSLQLGAMTLLFTLFGSGFYFLYVRRLSADAMACGRNVEETGDSGDFKETILALVLGTVVAVLLSAVVLIPNVLQLLSSSRGGENQSYLSIMRQHGLKDLFERLYQAFHPVMFAVGAVFLWKEWRRRRKDKSHMSPELKYLLVWNGFLWLTVVAQPSNLIWHLGSYMCFPVRYAYMILLSEVLLVKYLAVQEDVQRAETEITAGDVDSRKQSNRKIVGMGMITAVLCIAAVFLTLYWAVPISQGFSSLAISTVSSVVVKVLLILVLMLVAGLFVVLSGKWRRQTVTVAVGVMGGIYFLFVLLPQDYPVRKMNEAAYEQMTEVYDSADGAENVTAKDIAGLLHEEDNGDWPLNAVLVTGRRSMTGYFPSGSGREYASAMEQLGYYTPWVSTRSLGGTVISDAILGIGRSGYSQELFTNGIILEQTTEELQDLYAATGDSNPLELQSRLGEMLAGESLLQVKKLEELPKDSEGCYVLELPDESALHLDAGQSTGGIGAQIDGQAVDLSLEEETGSWEQLLYLGNHQSGAVKLKITDGSGNELSVAGSRLGILDVAGWKETASETAADDRIGLTVHDKEGKLTVSLSDIGNAKTVMLPVAYTKGWKVSCGEVSADGEALFGGFLGADISKFRIADQSAELEFTFEPEGLKVGVILTLAGILLLLFYLWFTKKGSKNRAFSAGGKVPEKTAFILYVIVISIALLAVYIVPNIGLMVNVVLRVLGIENKETVEQPHVRIAQVEVIEEGIQVELVEENLMLSKGVRVKADSEESEDFPAAMVNDGISDEGESRWSSENNWEDNEHWLRVDFGKETDIVCVKLFWERTNACEYTVEYSDDQKNWKVAAAFSQTPKEKEQTIFLEEPIKARYLRLHVLNVTKEEEDLSLYYQNVSLTELEVYGETAGSLLIEKPVIESGYDRILEPVQLSDGYSLKFGGADYENLVLEDGRIGDTLSDVEAELGFVLMRDDLEWELPGMKVMIPASEPAGGLGTNAAAEESSVENEGDAVMPDAVEWKAEGGECIVTDEVQVTLLETAGADTVLLQKMSDLFKDELAEVFASKETLYEDIPSETEGDGNVASRITLKTEGADNNYLGEEGYEIRIEEKEISIVANSPQGIRWGCVALKDMLQEASETERGLAIPTGTIRDYPKYEVRGFGIDVGRRAISIELLYEMVKELSAHKMNTLQIHLNDNQIIPQSDYDGTLEGARKLYSGFRLESDIRNQAGEGITSTDLYYTKEEFVRLIEDAAVYGVEIVPEIDTPAHSLSLTKVFPELGMSSDPEAADMLDLSKAKARQIGKDIWSEYLTEDIFADCKALHLGMDEYYGDAGDYLAYLQELSSHVQELAPEKELRIWGSLTMKGGDLSGVSKDLQMHIWDVSWADPADMYEEGFSLINSLSSSLYLIPGGGYDRLDVEYLEEKWQPNVYDTTERTWVIPAWSERCLGACYMMWNDWAHLNGVEITEEGLFDRFREPLPILADKLW